MHSVKALIISPGQAPDHAVFVSTFPVAWIFPGLLSFKLKGAPGRCHFCQNWGSLYPLHACTKLLVRPLKGIVTLQRVTLSKVYFWEKAEAPFFDYPLLD